MDQFDLAMVVNSDPKKGRPKPYSGRPWKVANGETRRHGNAAGRSRAEVVAILHAHGHAAPLPAKT